MNNINEFGTVAIPFITYTVAKFDGQKLYGSPILRKQFITALAETGKTKPIINEIKKLVERKIVIPCIVKKGLFDYIMYKTINPNQKLASSIPVLGFYDSGSKKVYVLTNNNGVFFESDSKLLLARYTIHELMHMAAELDPKFIDNFKEELNLFYYNMYKEMFKLKSKVNVEPIVKFIYNLELENNYTVDKLTRYYTLLDSTFKNDTTLNKNEFEKTLTDYMLAIRLLMSGPGPFKKNVDKFIHIIRPIYKSYKESFGINLKYLVIQELIIVSEVVCIYSETRTSNKVYTSIKNLVK